MKIGLRRYAMLATGLAVGGALMALAACGSAASTVSAAAPAAGGTLVHQSIRIVTGKMLHKAGWPQYQPAFWTVPAAGDTVLVTITSYDDGTAPLAARSPYAQVAGTVNGTETVNGKVMRSIPAAQVAHTFTMPALGVNLVIPAAPTGKTMTVQAVIHFSKAGTYYWHCFAPCGTGTDGLGGPMAAPGWMEGTVTVQG